MLTALKPSIMLNGLPYRKSFVSNPQSLEKMSALPQLDWLNVLSCPHVSVDQQNNTIEKS
jgi:hypothetical protein